MSTNVQLKVVDLYYHCPHILPLYRVIMKYTYVSYLVVQDKIIDFEYKSMLMGA